MLILSYYTFNRRFLFIGVYLFYNLIQRLVVLLHLWLSLHQLNRRSAKIILNGPRQSSKICAVNENPAYYHVCAVKNALCQQVKQQIYPMWTLFRLQTRHYEDSDIVCLCRIHIPNKHVKLRKKLLITFGLMCVVQETSEPTLMCLVSLQLLAQ